MKIFYYDLETTGVKYWKNGIHQISGAIEIDGELKEEFDFHVQPHPSAEIIDEALEIGGVTREQITAYPPMSEVYSNIINMLKKYINKYDKTDKFYLCGFNNAAFDNQFFRAFFVQNNDTYFGSWFWSNSLDVFVLLTPLLIADRANLPNAKLATLAKHFGIKVDDAKLHDGSYDIRLTRQLYYLFIQKTNLL